MQHERDDDRPELDEAEGESGALAPDLTAAFFAALDEGDAAVPPPPMIEQRLEALLDLSSAFDSFDVPRLVDDPPPVEGSATPEALEAAVVEPGVLVEPVALLAPHLDQPIDPLAVVPEAPAPAPVMAEDATPDVPLDLEEFIVFSLADTRCVVPIRNVVEVGRIPESAPVPHAPAWLHGLGNLRGQVLSLIDLRAFLGLGRIRPSAGRMIVLRADADEVVAGLMVDQVHQIVQLAPSRFQAAPSTLPPGYGGFVWGVCEYGLHTMVGLDVDGVLGAEAAHGESALTV